MIMIDLPYFAYSFLYVPWIYTFPIFPTFPTSWMHFFSLFSCEAVFLRQVLPNHVFGQSFLVIFGLAHGNMTF
jgi:hypothetical protein